MHLAYLKPLFIGGIFALLHSIGQAWWPLYLNTTGVKLALFTALVSWFTRRMVLKEIKGNNSLTAQFFLAGVVFKLLVYICGASLYFYFANPNKNETVFVVVWFAIYYLLFTFVDIHSFLHNLRAEKKNA